MKTIKITPTETLAEFKENFSELFPNLKIEFFNKEHETGTGNMANELLKDLNQPLKEVCNVDHDFAISVDGHKKVSTLENDFADLGLNIQVFRKSGSIWLQTTTTDYWTLSDQNREAEATKS